MSFYQKLLRSDVDVEIGGGNSSNDTLLEKGLQNEYLDDGTYKLSAININEDRKETSRSRNFISWKAVHITLSMLNLLILAALVIQADRPNHGPNLIACMSLFL